VTVVLLYSAGDTHHLEQLAAIHGLYYLTLADSEDCRLDLINSQHLGGIQLIDGECRPGLVAVQGALASALDRNWTNLALCITRTPPFGGRSDVEKFAEENGGAGAQPHCLGFLVYKLQLVQSLSGDALGKSLLRIYVCS
jgi:hypothetical protein